MDRDFIKDPDASSDKVAAANGGLSADVRDKRATRRVFPIHPVFFAAFPLFALYAENLDEVPIGQLLPPLLASVIASIVLWTVFLTLTRHNRKSALLASSFVLAFFSYQHILNVLPSSVHALVGPGLVIILAAIVAVTLKLRFPLVDMTVVLNLASFILIVPSAWTIGSNLVAGSATRDLSHRQRVAASKNRKSTSRLPARHRKVLQLAKQELPDIYYIVLDAYGRTDSLKKFYEFDNSPFISALQERGFYIAENSRANYDQTPLCLASALNMSYLDSESLRQGGDADALETARQMMDDNMVAEFLARQGYHYVYIWSGTESTRVDSADLVLKSEENASSFEGKVLGMTGLDATTDSNHKLFDQHRLNLRGAFGNLSKVANLPYRKFVFTHILAPHPPFVLAEDGGPVYPPGSFGLDDASWLLTKISRQQYQQGYISQLKYINKRTLQAVDSILRQSKRRPIIIIQGDHGSRMNLDWDSQEKTDLREPFSILNAYLVPKDMRTQLYDSITPINSFRIILSQQFGAKYKTVSDRSFYSTAANPDGFSEVTRLIPRM